MEQRVHQHAGGAGGVGLGEALERLCRGGVERPMMAADPWSGRCLPRGAVHEWIAAENGLRGCGLPVAVARHFARRSEGFKGATLWVGRGVWPYLPGLDPAAPPRDLMVDPPDMGARVWAMDLALCSEAVTVVVGDGTGFTMAHTRRLQLAAKAGRTVCLLLRPAWERLALSAAATRWIVTPRRVEGDRPGWRVERVRCKGLRWADGTAADATRTWDVELGRGGDLVAVPAVPALPGAPEVALGLLQPRRGLAARRTG